MRKVVEHPAKTSGGLPTYTIYLDDSNVAINYSGRLVILADPTGKCMCGER